jgi:hypothetical protein
MQIKKTIIPFILFIFISQLSIAKVDLGDNAYFISEVSFTDANAIVDEENTTVENGCDDYQDHTTTLIIQQAPTANTDVNIIDLGTGTATPGVDYEIITTGILILSGSNLSQDFTIRIYNDAIIEANETIILGYNLNANGGDAIIGTNNQTHTITIKDVDVAPLPSVTITPVDEDFEIGLGTFTTVNANSAGVFQQGDFFSAKSFCWLTFGNFSSFAFVNDDACNCDMSDVKLISPSIDLSNTITASLSFDHAFSDMGSETAAVLISTDGGTNWSASIHDLIGITTFSSNEGGYETEWQTGITVDLSDYAGMNNIKIAFSYNDAGFGFGLAIDNVVLSASSKPLNIQTSTISTEEHLGPNATVHFYDPSNQNIICTIENTSAHDYGCTTVEVDRAGNSFLDIGGTYRVFDKQFLVIPTSNNPSGTYNIILYYTAAERNGFINDNDLSYDLADFRMYKSTASLSTANTLVSAMPIESILGIHYTYTASFSSGFSGFGIGAGNGPLPVELLSFAGKNIDPKTNHLTWETATEINSDYFQIERSTDADHFEKIGQIKAAGNAT